MKRINGENMKIKRAIVSAKSRYSLKKFSEHKIAYDKLKS